MQVKKSYMVLLIAWNFTAVFGGADWPNRQLPIDGGASPCEGIDGQQECRKWRMIIYVALSDESSRLNFGKIQSFIKGLIFSCTKDYPSTTQVIIRTAQPDLPVGSNGHPMLTNCTTTSSCNKMIEGLDFKRLSIDAELDVNEVSFPAAELASIFLNELVEWNVTDTRVLTYLITDFVNSKLERENHWIQQVLTHSTFELHLVSILKNAHDRQLARKLYNATGNFYQHIVKHSKHLAKLIPSVSPCEFTDGHSEAPKHATTAPPDADKCEHIQALSPPANCRFASFIQGEKSLRNGTDRPPWRLLFIVSLASDPSTTPSFYKKLSTFVTNTALNCLEQAALEVRLILADKRDSDWCGNVTACKDKLGVVTPQMASINKIDVLEDDSVRHLTMDTLQRLRNDSFCGLTAVIVVTDYVSQPMADAAEDLKCWSRVSNSMLMMMVIADDSKKEKEFVWHAIYEDKYEHNFVPSMFATVGDLTKKFGEKCLPDPSTTNEWTSTKPVESTAATATTTSFETSDTPNRFCRGASCKELITGVVFTSNHTEEDYTRLFSFLGSLTNEPVDAIKVVSPNGHHPWTDNVNKSTFTDTEFAPKDVPRNSDPSVEFESIISRSLTHLAFDIRKENKLYSIGVFDSYPKTQLAEKHHDSILANVDPVKTVYIVVNEKSAGGCQKKNMTKTGDALLICLRTFDDLQNVNTLFDLSDRGPDSTTSRDPNIYSDGPTSMWIPGVVLGSAVIVVAGLMLFVYKQRNKRLIWDRRLAIHRIRHQTDLRNSISGMDQWEIPKENLVVDYERRLGSGAFGTVYHGRITGERYPLQRQYSMRPNNSANSNHVAIKMLNLHCVGRGKAKFQAEIEFMKTIGQHAHIVNMVGCVTNEEPYCLVAEYCARGDLKHFIKERTYVEMQPLVKITDHDRQSTLSQKELLSFAWQIADGMVFLKQKGYVHRDLAARNILVDEAGTAKIGDFGQCQLTGKHANNSDKETGRIAIKWMAIETLRTQNFSTQSDVFVLFWSFGVLLYELFSMGEEPYDNMELINVVTFLSSGARLRIPKYATDLNYKLMYSCWNDDPQQRPTFEKARQELAQQLDGVTVQYGYVQVLNSIAPTLDTKIDLLS